MTEKAPIIALSGKQWVVMWSFPNDSDKADLPAAFRGEKQTQKQRACLFPRIIQHVCNH